MNADPILWNAWLAGGAIGLYVLVQYWLTGRPLGCSSPLGQDCAMVSRLPIRFKRKPYVRTLVPGSLVFGVGWGLTGGCPGTVLAMLGEGKLYVLPIIAGLLAGTWLFGLWSSRSHQSS